MADQLVDSLHGYILEADLEHPVELHELRNAYPLAPEQTTIQKERMSQYQQQLLGACRGCTYRS